MIYIYIYYMIFAQIYYPLSISIAFMVSHPHSNLEPLLALAEAAVGRKVGRLWRGKGVATNDEDQLSEIGKLTTWQD